VLLLPGSLVSTSVGPLEVFRHAGVVWNMLTGIPQRPAFQVTTASAAPGPVSCDGGFEVRAATTIDTIRRTDLVLVPSTGLDLPSAVTRNAAVVPWLRAMHRRGAVLAGVCSGVELIAATGLLDGRPATTHWGLVDRMRTAYPAVQWLPERMVTDADRVVCGAGMYACLDLSLHLVERFCGRPTALQTAQAFLIEPGRATQAGFVPPGPAPGHGDDLVATAERRLREHYAEPLRVEDLSARAGLSTRQFSRRFREATGTTPLEYLHRERIRVARAMLETADVGVQDISLAVGYDDVAFFRRLFRRHTGSAPQDYRRRFGQVPGREPRTGGRIEAMKAPEICR
jgi:transcriptional regulator GlxA family with amidase domain